MKFHELAVGDKFTIDYYGECEKISPTQYRTADGRVRRTSGTANVNGPSGDKARAATVKAENEQLNQVAQASGYCTWYDLERHALAGEMVVINARDYKPLEFRTSDEAAKMWGVTVRRAQAHIALLNARFGVGRKVGRDWLLSADEAERHPPRQGAGRPPKAE